MNESVVTGSNSSNVMAAMPSPSNVADSSKAVSYEFHPSIAEEERRFYLKAYPTVEIVRDRKVHCTVCKTHIGTAPIQEVGIKMHPILRVTHCMKCHDFYNSGEFSKGEDGSELYCRWCGQGGEVYCCSSCPYVFCKSCIVKNLSRGVVADIEQNENWNCFSCAPKILWPLRAQHWALMNYIEQQKKEVQAMNLNETELRQYLQRDRSKCCRLAKSKCGNMSDSMESLDSVASKRSHGSSGSAKKPLKHSATPSPQPPNAKRAKTNDEVVCTPDLLSMLEPDCQITLSQKTNLRPILPAPSASTPRIMSIQQPNYGIGSTSTPKTSAPPPLVLRNTGIKLRAVTQPPIVRRTVIGPRAPAPGGNGTPVYHTINGYRIDLNSAAQQETFRLPNGKLIQVKRQGPPPGSNSINLSPVTHSWQQMTGQQQSSPQQQQRVVPQTIASRPVQITQHTYAGPHIQQQSQHPQVVRYHNSMIGSTTINAVGHNGTPLQAMNGQMPSGPPQNVQQQQTPGAPIRPVMVRHIFPENPIGSARTQLQEQVFNAMEICTHLTNKVQTLTNSNAYKQAKNYLEVKELYIHLSYLLTYAVGRFKGLQDKCLADMRHLGFGNDADCLENGQLAADKQASDDEDNEIEIVEPKTDLITLDSDDDEPPVIKIQKPLTPTTTHIRVTIPPSANVQKSIDEVLTIPSGTTVRPVLPTANMEEENLDLMTMAQSFLASMLEVDIHEGSAPHNSPSSSDSTQLKKQPRKKMTNKPNPTLLKQKALMERERLEEMKRNDHKLKMKCAVQLKKAEDEYPYAKEMLKAKLLEKEKNMKEASTTMVVNTGKETIEVQLVIEDDNMNSSTEDKDSEEVTKAIVNVNQEGNDGAGGTAQKKIILIEEEEAEKSAEDEASEHNEAEEETKKDATEQINEDNELEQEEETEKTTSSEMDKDTTMIIFEISDDVVDKEKSLEVVEASQEKDKKEAEVEVESPTNNGTCESENTPEQGNDNEKRSSCSPAADVAQEEEATEEEEKGNDKEEPMEEDDNEDTTAPSNVSKNEEEGIKMETDSVEAADATPAIKEATTTNDSQLNETNEAAHKSKEDLEDAEVYKEIEKVLQRRHDDDDNDNDAEDTHTEAEEKRETAKETTKETAETNENEKMMEKPAEEMPSNTPTAEKESNDSEILKETDTNKTETDVEKESMDSDSIHHKAETEKEAPAAAAVLEDDTTEVISKEEASSPSSPSLEKSGSQSPKDSTTNSSCPLKRMPVVSESIDIETKEKNATVPPPDSCAPEEITSNGKV